MHLPSSILPRGLFATALVLTATALHAAGSFEGRMEMKITDSDRGGSRVFSYAQKGGMMRIDLPKDASMRHEGAVIVDLKKHEMLMLMEMPDNQGGPPRKMYMRHVLPQANATAARSEGGDEAVSAPVPTGRTEVIAGYPASEYKMTDKKGNVHELWLAKGLGDFMYPFQPSPMRAGSANASPAWVNLIREGGFFPLRVVTMNARGRETERMEVTKIERMTLPASLFSTEGYDEFKIPGFGGGSLSGLNPFKH